MGYLGSIYVYVLLWSETTVFYELYRAKEDFWNLLNFMPTSKSTLFSNPPRTHTKWLTTTSIYGILHSGLDN